MTAAAHESYDVTPDEPMPPGAFERAVEDDVVVYLTQGGRTLAKIVPMKAEHEELERLAAAWQAKEEHAARVCARLREAVAGADPGIRQVAEELIDEILEAAEIASDVAASDAAMADPEPAVPWERVKADLGL